MDNGATLAKFTEFLRNSTPFVFAKFGDGELLCMDGEVGCNCDRHPYTPQLATKLKAALYNISGNANAYIADWCEDKFIQIRHKYSNPTTRDNMNLVDYQLVLSQVQNFKDPLREFYREIKRQSLKRTLIFIIPEALNGISDYIGPRCKIINVPKVNSFSKYDDIHKQVLDALDDNSIIITACGMMAKVLTSDVVLANPTSTCIDFGSAFDPLLVGHTRDGQADKSDVKSFFDTIGNV